MADASAGAPLPLSRYNAKRDFNVTSEPAGTLPKTRKSKALVFVVQKHWASRLHYDFRLELDGVMLSWAVPKGPSYDPAEKRMAVHVEDHPLSYNTFEGTIPAKQYGAGTVIVWDNGTWDPVGDPREGMTKGKLVFNLHSSTGPTTPPCAGKRIEATTASVGQATASIATNKRRPAQQGASGLASRCLKTNHI